MPYIRFCPHVKTKKKKYLVEKAVLKQFKTEIEKCASEAIEQMTKRHENVQQAELNIFKEQVAVVNKWKEDKLQTFHKEMSQLDHLDAKQQEISKSGNNLLQHTSSPDFIGKSDTFLTYNRLTELPTPIDTSWSPILYHQPLNWRMLDTEHFRNYMQETSPGLHCSQS